MMVLLKIIKSVLFWFFITVACSLAVLYLHFFCGVEQSFNEWKEIYPLLTSLLIGLLTSFAFYYLVVFLPQRHKKKIIKSNFKKLYLNIKEDILHEIIWASQKGGRNDLHVDTKTTPRLMNHKGFREAFDKGKEGNEGWYAFVNGVTSNQEHYQAIIDKFQLLAKQVEYLLLNYQIDNQEFFDFFKRLETILLEAKSLDPNTDDIKPFCRFLCRSKTKHHGFSRG